MDDIYIVYNNETREIYALVHENGLSSIDIGNDPNMKIIKFGSFGAEMIRTGSDGKLYLMSKIMVVRHPQ